jgi:hypothetical protein
MEAGGLRIQGQTRQSEGDPALNKQMNERVGGMVQVVECLPDKWEAFGSILALLSK